MSAEERNIGMEIVRKFDLTKTTQSPMLNGMVAEAINNEVEDAVERGREEERARYLAVHPRAIAKDFSELGQAQKAWLERGRDEERALMQCGHSRAEWVEMESAWLLERSPYYLSSFTPPPGQFTADALAALKFKSKEEAERARDAKRLLAWEAIQHGFQVGYCRACQREQQARREDEKRHLRELTNCKAEIRTVVEQEGREKLQQARAEGAAGMVEAASNCCISLAQSEWAERTPNAIHVLTEAASAIRALLPADAEKMLAERIYLPDRCPFCDEGQAHWHTLNEIIADRKQRLAERDLRVAEKAREACVDAVESLEAHDEYPSFVNGHQALKAICALDLDAVLRETK